MRIRVLAVAIAAGFGMTSFSAIAAPDQAAPSTSVTISADDLGRLQAQLVDLQAKVASLEDRTDAQSDINVNTRHSVAALEQKTTNTEATDKLAALINNTRVNGTLYVDLTNQDQENHGSKTAASGSGLDVKRFYLSIDHQFNDIWSANLTTDFNFVSNDSETQLFVKKAYLQGAFDKMAALRIGSANMPWIPYVEDWYGYRFVENTLIDRGIASGGAFSGGSFGNSADWGVHLLGDNGLVNYQASVVNGGGYKNPTRSDNVDFEGRLGFTPFKGFVVAVGGYQGKLGKDTSTVPTQHDARRVDALVAWNANNLRSGVEYFKADNWKNVTSPLGDSATGYSLWSSYDFGVASIFARYDRVKPSKELDPSLEDKYYNVGVAFPVTKGVRVALVYKDDRLRDDGAVDFHSREVGAWGEVKW